MKLLKKLKRKRCEKCIYKFKTGNIFACFKYGTEYPVICPLKLFCFRYKRGD